MDKRIFQLASPQRLVVSGGGPASRMKVHVSTTQKLVVRDDEE